MPRALTNFIDYGLWLFVFLIPWQARWIIVGGEINAGYWEYGTQSLYTTEILLGVILAAVIVKYIVETAVARRLDKNNETPQRGRLYGPAGALFLLIVWAGISIGWSIDKNVALTHWRVLVEAAAVFLLIAAAGTRSGAFVQKIQWAVILSAIVQIGFVVAQSNMQFIPASTVLGLAAQSASDLGVSVVETMNGRWLRAYGTFPHPNILGGWLVLALMATMTLWREAKVQGTRYKAQVFVFPICFIILLFGLLFTFSRSAWLALLLVTCYLLLSGFRNKARLLFTLKLIALMVVTVVTFAAIFPDPFFSRFSSNRLEHKSQIERIGSWRESLSLIKNHPLLGVGVGNYGLAVQKEIEPNQPAWYYQPAHNLPLLIWSELGLVGILVIGCWLLVVGWRHNWSRAAMYLLPLLAIAMFDHYLWSLYPGLMIGAVWLGLACSPLPLPGLTEIWGECRVFA